MALSWWRRWKKRWLGAYGELWTGTKFNQPSKNEGEEEGRGVHWVEEKGNILEEQ